MLLLRQIGTLTRKNLLIVLFRRRISTPVRALLLPVVLAWFLTYARNIFVPPSTYGIGNPRPLVSLQDSLALASGGRNILALVDNGFTGGPIGHVVGQIAITAREHTGTNVQILSNEADLLTICKSSLRGASACIAGVVFHSSPTEGPDGLWNYTLRADGALGTKIDTTSSTNDPNVYVLPLQHAIDSVIASSSGAVDVNSFDPILEYTFTSLTQAQHADQIRISYMKAIVQIIAVAFFITMCGVTFHLTGLMASERESQMSQLIECMMPNTRRWEPQAARLLSYHLSFSIIYFPGWLGIGLVLAVLVFLKTNPAILIVSHLLAGLSLTSFSIFGASFFRKAQLSGIILVIVSLLLAVVAQFVVPSTGAVVILSLLFPPMTYTFLILLMAQHETRGIGINLLRADPDNPWAVRGLILLIFFIAQIVVFPVLGALVERWLYSKSNARRPSLNDDSPVAVQLQGFTKSYAPNWFARVIRRKKDKAVAVNELNLEILSGQIMVLLGANGSGKSTTLTAIAGLTAATTGSIAVSAGQGIGFCPQGNVLLEQCTVEENVGIFNRLKSLGRMDSKAEIHELIRSCDLDEKIGARVSSLSGGQMRKLQLCLMFTGGSQICLVDECSSGVDTLARRSLQNILLRERSRSNRTIILTTHFLDEADTLSDRIAILSNGTLRAEGTAPEIKSSFGAHYRIHVHRTAHSKSVPTFAGAIRQDIHDRTILTVPDSAQAADLLTILESQGFSDCSIDGPTIEDVFMGIADEMKDTSTSPKDSSTVIDSTDKPMSILTDNSRRPVALEKAAVDLHRGNYVNLFEQWLILFRKRATIFQRNPLPNMLALFLPIVATILTALFLRGFQRTGCSPGAIVTSPPVRALATQTNYSFLVGPSSRFSVDVIGRIASTLPSRVSDTTKDATRQTLTSSLRMVESQSDFGTYLHQRFSSLTPGGFYIGGQGFSATLVYRGDGDVSLAAISQNALNNVLFNQSVATQYQPFAAPLKADGMNTLQFCVYLGLSMAVYPAFFALYPCTERLKKVRALQYSNGVRAVPLWLAHVVWDFLFVLASAVISIVILSTSTNAWYHLEYLFVVFCLYGLTSALYSYTISLFAQSQLAAFALSAASQAIMFLLTIVAYISTLTFSPVNKTNPTLLDLYFTRALVSPSTNLARALFLSLNIYSILCRDTETVSYPGGITVYGGPILYLVGQAIVLLTIIIWRERGGTFRNPFRPRHPPTTSGADIEDAAEKDDEVVAERNRVTESTTDPLRVLNLSKRFSRISAVQNISFSVSLGQVFALLGPNGAGKSTIINMIRGEIAPSKPLKGITNPEITVSDTSILTSRTAARQKLGVCPQFDALDQMTVFEHLRFYARIRGLSDVDHNVSTIIRAVGLQSFETRLAARLSGGSKRKLSLGIALMGNPAVLLLDEPSSGMDVAAKRNMWRTLSEISRDRSILLTTHSMEEADALGDRVGIMATRMLALGTSDYLRRKMGDLLHVHLSMQKSQSLGFEKMDVVLEWIADTFPTTTTDVKAYYGQVRFVVQTNLRPIAPKANEELGQEEDEVAADALAQKYSLGALFSALESNKERLGIEYYSVNKTTFDDVFVKVVEQNNREEERGKQNKKEEVGREEDACDSGFGVKRLQWIGRLRRD